MGLDVIKTIQTPTPVDIGLIKSIDDTCHDDNHHRCMSLSVIRTIKITQSHKDKDDSTRMDRVTRNRGIYRDKR